MSDPIEQIFMFLLVICYVPWRNVYLNLCPFSLVLHVFIVEFSEFFMCSVYMFDVFDAIVTDSF